MSLRLHAIVLALNEEVFIENQLRSLYPYCTGISVLTQYDRDWYGQPVKPDNTLTKVVNFPDPEGKIHLVLRRFPDEAAARNSEMRGLVARPDRGTMSHGSPAERIRNFHAEPDYFWIVDADEFYDSASIPAIIEHLGSRRPRGMRIFGMNYLRTWNRRVVNESKPFCHFGFIRPGVLFECRRTVSWNESRLSRLLTLLRLPDFSARVFGFEICPREIGVFHHACWIGDNDRLALKHSRSSHSEVTRRQFETDIAGMSVEYVARDRLPRSLIEFDWPPGFFE